MCLRCHHALVFLLAVKARKDTTGKDAVYLREQPRAWAEAREAVAVCENQTVAVGGEA